MCEVQRGPTQSWVPLMLFFPQELLYFMTNTDMSRGSCKPPTVKEQPIRKHCPLMPHRVWVTKNNQHTKVLLCSLKRETERSQVPLSEHVKCLDDLPSSLKGGPTRD